MNAANKAKEVAARPAITDAHSVETVGLIWLAVHGALSLALRHPLYQGPSRDLLISFHQELGNKLVEWEVLKPAELEWARLVEQEESPHQ